MSTPSPTPSRTKAPSWLDLRLVLGVVLVLASVLLGAKVVSGANHTYRMLATTRDLATGTLLAHEDLTVIRVQVPDHGRDTYLSGNSDVLGKQLNRPLARGELLPAAALDAPAALTTVTIPFAADAAPTMSPGQRVEIWMATKTCASIVLLADVTVQDVHAASGTSFTSSGGQDIVVSVPPSLAGRVVSALAREDSTIRAGILTGPVQPAANDGLPELDDCPAHGGQS